MKNVMKLMVIALMVMAVFLVGCAVEEVEEPTDAELETAVAEMSDEEIANVLEDEEADENAALAGNARYTPKYYKIGNKYASSKRLYKTLKNAGLIPEKKEIIGENCVDPDTGEGDILVKSETTGVLFGEWDDNLGTWPTSSLTDSCHKYNKQFILEAICTDFYQGNTYPQSLGGKTPVKIKGNFVDYKIKDCGAGNVCADGACVQG
jgi:hypothetical protein